MNQMDLMPDAQFLDYCLQDSVSCLDLWRNFSPHWPEHERHLARITVEQGERGVYVDQERLQDGLQRLTAECQRCEQLIPWAGAEPVTSIKSLHRECGRHGIEPPKSTAKTSEEFGQWLEQHRNTLPWVDAIGQWRRANRLLHVLKTIDARTGDNGRLRFSLKYFGAAVTGRWSGDAGLNMQNLNRDTVCGVDVRNILSAAPHHKLVVADLSQIEPRCLAWLCGDTGMLDRVRQGVPLYEAHARQTMGWTGGILKKENPHLYALAKARVLGLGYGCGSKQFVNVARIMAGLEVTIKDAARIVRDFRSTNPQILQLWQRLENNMRADVGKEVHGYRLPSGRWMRYFNITEDDEGKLKAAVVRGGPQLFWHGAKLAENLVQACARDVFAYGLIEAENQGVRTLWTVHDEIVAEAPENAAEDVLSTLEAAMRKVPEWMPGLPLEVEGQLMERYAK